MKKINFLNVEKLRFFTEEKIKPSKEFKPEFYKNAPFYVDENNKKDNLKIINGEANATFKKCIPFIDALNAGYMVSLCADVLVSQNQNGYDVTWKSKKDIFQLHGNNTNLIEGPDNFHSHVIKYTWGVLPKTPPGYSLLVLPPLGFHNVVFRQIPAIVDTDKNDLQFALPMWVKKNYDGIVEAGTPLAQLIPFKKESWKSKQFFLNENDYFIIEENGFNKKIKNHYKNKSFNKIKFL